MQHNESTTSYWVYFDYLLQAMMEEVSEYLDDIQTKCNDHANHARSAYQSRRWEVTRLGDSLVEGEHQEYLALHIGTKTVDFVHMMNGKDPDLKAFYDGTVLVNPSVEDMKENNTLSLFVDHSTDVAKYVKSSLENCKVALKSKMAQLDEKFEQKATYVGTLGHVSGAQLDKDFCTIAELAHTEKVGAEAWAIACCQHYKRADSSRVPLRGVSALFCAIDQAFAVYACPMLDVLDKGVSWEDLENWFESEKGQVFLEESMTCVVVRPGNCLYIPHGMFWACVHLEVDKYMKASKEEEVSDDEDAGPKRSKLQLSPKSVGHACIWPLFVEEWLEAMPSKVKLALTAMNVAVFDKNTTKKMWKDRADFFRDVFSLGPAVNK